MNVRIDSSRQHQHAFGIDRFCAGRRRQVPSNFGDDTVANAKVRGGAWDFFRGLNLRWNSQIPSGACIQRHYFLSTG